MKTVLVRDLISQNVLKVVPQTPLSEVVGLMKESRLSCTLIVEQGSPVGILTERDIVRVLDETIKQKSFSDQPVSQYMTLRPVCINDQANLYEALVVSQSNSVRHLPVVDGDGQLSGIVTQTDIARAHLLAIEEQRLVIEQQISDRTIELEEANRELKALTLQDPLMKIGNRRSMEVDVEFTHQGAVRYQGCYSLAMIDVDHFKFYNDYYGHLAGDEVLARIADCIKCCIRDSDRLYRYGGEELLYLMPETELAEARLVVGRIMRHLENEHIPHVNSPFSRITVSAGLCDLATAVSGNIEASWKDLIEIADKCLYEAKSKGRNCLVDPASD